MQYAPVNYRDSINYRDWLKTVTDQTLNVLWSMFYAPSDEPIADYREFYGKAVMIQKEMDSRNLKPKPTSNQ